MKRAARTAEEANIAVAIVISSSEDTRRGLGDWCRRQRWMVHIRYGLPADVRASEILSISEEEMGLRAGSSPVTSLLRDQSTVIHLDAMHCSL